MAYIIDEKREIGDSKGTPGALKAYLGTWVLEEHLGTGHSNTWGTREHEGHLGSWHSRHLGAWVFKHLDTRALEEHLGTQVLADTQVLGHSRHSRYFT